MRQLIPKWTWGDMRRLAIDHGEKGAAGGIGLGLLAVLLTSHWSTYEKTAAELTERTRTAQVAIARNVLPNPQRYSLAAGLQTRQVRELVNTNERQRTERVRRAIAWYGYSTPLLHSLRQSHEPARRPELVAAEDPLATFGRMIFPYRSIAPEVPEYTPVATSTAPESRERRLRSSFAQESSIDSPSDPAAATPRYETVRQVRGMRYVSVRYVIDLYRQIENMRDALNVPTHADAAEQVVYWDFDLQRRSRPAAGGQTWSQWRTVDLDVALDIMREAADWEAELVDVAVTDSALTMPLPSRLLYYWSTETVSHPRIEQFVLSPERRQRQMAMLGHFLEQDIRAAQRVKQNERGGFGSIQRDARSAGGSLAGAGMRRPGAGLRSLISGDLVNSIADRLDRADPRRIKQELLAQLMESQSAAGRLLLFRYLDFDVEPATSYQYRVRLVLLNPNFGRPAYAVVDPEITHRRFLETPLSRPTAAVTVPADAAHFVTEIDEEYGTHQKNATFDIYQWLPQLGTMVNRELTVTPGSFVGGREEAEVFDAARQQFCDGQMIDFETGRLLVDVLDAPRPLDVEQHPDLAIPRETLRTGLGVVEQVLLVNEFGELVTGDPASSGRTHAAARQRFQAGRAPFLHFKRAAGGNRPGALNRAAYERQFGRDQRHNAAPRSRPVRNPLRRR